jgi:hypothetical protein
VKTARPHLSIVAADPGEEAEARASALLHEALAWLLKSGLSPRRIEAKISDSGWSASLVLDSDQCPCSARSIGDNGPPLAPIERAVLLCLHEKRERRTTAQLLEDVEECMGEPVSEGVVKILLARLTAPQVAILDNDRHAHPAGYGLTALGERYARQLQSAPAKRLAK